MLLHSRYQTQQADSACNSPSTAVTRRTFVFGALMALFFTSHKHQRETYFPQIVQSSPAHLRPLGQYMAASKQRLLRSSGFAHMERTKSSFLGGGLQLGRSS